MTVFALWFALCLFAALQVAAVAVAIVARIWTLRPRPVTWRGIDVPIASHYVERYLIDIDDSRFAYPTGMFLPDPATDKERGRVVLREANFSGSQGLRWIRSIHARMRAGSARDARHTDSIGLLLFLVLLRGSFALALSVPLAVGALLDMIYRPLFRSRIEAHVRRHPEHDDAVTIQLQLRGMSAFGITSDVLRGMAPARLPAELAAAVGVTDDPDAQSASDVGARARAAAWVSQADRRFRVIQTSAVGVAVVAALAVAAFVSSRPGTEFESYDDVAAAQQHEAPYGDESYGDDDGLMEDVTGSSDADDGWEEEPADVEQELPPHAYVGTSYTIVPPAGWVRESAEVSRGSFDESRWHAPGRERLYVLIDRSEGIGGDARSSGAPVRRAVSQTDGYVEHAWEPYGDRQLWEFSSDDMRKIDIFSVRCGDGYAVLGAAPEHAFERYRETFHAFADSLVPDCERESASEDDAAGAGADGPLDAVEAFRYPAGTQEHALEQAIRRHFQARVDGDYAGAYALYGPGLREKAGDGDSWGRAIAKDGLQEVVFDELRVGLRGGKAGVARARFTTISRAAGCHRHNVRYTLRKQGGTWLLWDSDAQDSVPC